MKLCPALNGVPSSVSTLQKSASWPKGYALKRRLRPLRRAMRTRMDMYVSIPSGLSQGQIADLEGRIAERCVDILVETGVFLCSAVYEPDK